MDLTPLYDLRERLKAGAVAGTALLTEDFRLPRALEALAPLEGAAPVFAKIGQGVRALLDPACPDRNAALLEALALVDAVLTTQSAVAVSGELQPIALTGRGSALTNAPYSVLSPLMEALTNSGGGRYSFVVDTHEQQPELFQDYRVKHALVAALGASYSELADRAEEWLSQGDAGVLPLLMEGFDPKGKREMVRRIHVIEAVSGAGSNAFYLDLLDSAEKDVRAAAVYALRHTQENVPRLITLAKTEKGAAKKQAYWALTHLDSPAAWEFWEALAAKKPEQAVEYMVGSASEYAGRLVAQQLLAVLAPYEADPSAAIPKEVKERLQKILVALPGKSGPEVCACYRRAAALGTALDRAVEGEKQKVMLLDCATAESDIPFSIAIPHVLSRSLFLRHTPELEALAWELYQKHGVRYAEPCLTAALLTQDADTVFEQWNGLLHGSEKWIKNRGQKECWSALEATFGCIIWDAEAGKQVMYHYFADPRDGVNRHVYRALAAPLSLDWYRAMAQAGDLYEEMLMRMARPGDEALCALLGQHFYDKALVKKNNERYLKPLCLLGWTRCQGLAVHQFRSDKRIHRWSLQTYLSRMPGSKTDKADEVESLIRLAETGHIGFTAGAGIDMLHQMVLELRGAPAGEG